MLHCSAAKWHHIFSLGYKYKTRRNRKLRRKIKKKNLNWQKEEKCGRHMDNRTTIPDIVLATQLEVLSASSITKELFTTPAAVYDCLFVVFRPRLYSAKKFSLLVSIRCLYNCCLFSFFSVLSIPFILLSFIFVFYCVLFPMWFWLKFYFSLLSWFFCCCWSKRMMMLMMLI